MIRHVRSGAVLQRVEAIFQAQHDLHRGYRAVLKEIHDLQLKKQVQERLDGMYVYMCIYIYICVCVCAYDVYIYIYMCV